MAREKSKVNLGSKLVPAEFGALVRQRRGDLHLTQLGLARRCGLTDVWVSSIERGGAKVSKAAFLIMLDSLGVPSRVSRYVFDDGLDGWEAILPDGGMRHQNGHICHPDGSHTIPAGSRAELPGEHGGYKIRFPDGKFLWVVVGDRLGPDLSQLGENGEIPAGSKVTADKNLFAGLRDVEYGELLLPGQSVEDEFTSDELRVIEIWRHLCPEAQAAGLCMLKGLIGFGPASSDDS